MTIIFNLKFTMRISTNNKNHFLSFFHFLFSERNNQNKSIVCWEVWMTENNHISLSVLRVRLVTTEKPGYHSDKATGC